ncbi:unnamed protein product [Colletotrichum noveboracense]|uniref:Uncharacterized protein n=1 Tax=Colletotrichum noveboracense TaxID=2664923 RepID=A0A9W4RSH7_9PEZI|nr:unnamed protein product [Colletotrichum noveboracense]
MISTPTERYQKAGRNKESLITNFLLSCETGDIQLITTILETGDYELLSAKDLESGLHLCALHGNLAIAQILLKNTSFQDRKSISGDLVFVTAAASGSVAMMKTCIHYWPELLQLPSVSALSLALTKSSENGDMEFVRYLVLELEVDVNITTPDRPLNLPEASHWNGQHPDLDLHSGRYLMAPEDTTNLPNISPLQSVLRGFRYGQKQTFNFLIDKGANPNDRGGQSMYPIQVAAKHCPEHVVDILIAAGADTNAYMGGDNENSFHDTPRIGNVHSGATDHKSALFQAAGRELSTLSLVRKLVAAGATLPSHTEEQHSLLEEALHHFKGDIAGTESFPFECQSDGKFTVTPSIAYLFQEGCAAALTFLLGQMPNVRTTSVQWGLVLQMAAFNGNLDIVELLLDRGTNINRIGHYCGTALQAASSQGHEKLVQKLLDAGAHVNTIAGRWQTALRAALVGGHEETVKLLLEHGAEVDMELPKSQTGRNTSHIKEDARTDLQLAVMTQNVDIVQHLLAQGANAVLDPDGTSHPLIIASANGSAAIVKGLIQAGAPVNIHGKRRSNGRIEPAEMSPMHAASAKGHLDVVEVLLNNHANVDINVKDAGTPLTIAANIGQARIVRHLLSAGAKDSNYQAFKNGISHDHVEVVRALLDAGALADSMLPVACERGHAETIELLIESFSDRKTLETALDEAFSISGLQDSVIQILLCYAAPTAQRFIHVCAAGSLATAKSILKQRSIDINVRSQKNGDSPLQVAALHLNSEVVRFLVEEGARIESTSPGHGPPLITALEAGAGLKLRFEQIERLRSIVDKLSIPITSNQSPYFWEYETSRSEAMQFAKCDAIVELLINHGAVVADVGRPLGSPLHIACLLGSSPMVESLIQRGAETEATAGYFEKPIFAAIHGKHADIVSILLKRAPNLSHFHATFATSLHYACAVGDAASVRMLLERGADATLHNLPGHTALTVALQNPYRNQKESPLDVILSMVESIRLSDDDLIAAFEPGNVSSKSLDRLLHLDKSTIFHEQVMCRVLSSRPYTDGITIKLLLPRMGGIGVTDQMLKSVANEETLKALLEHRPVSKITAEVLLAQKKLKCIELLLKFDGAAPITEELVLRVLALREYGGVQRNVLLNLFERNPALCVTEDMLQAVDSAENLGVLLSHLKPDVAISEHTLDRLFGSCPWEGQERLRLLLNHDSSIQLTDKIILKILQNRWYSPIYILELLLDYRPSMVVTAEMFLLVWGKSSEDGRMRIPGLFKKHGKRIQFTDNVIAAIDEAFSLTEEPLKESLYELRAADE